MEAAGLIEKVEQPKLLQFNFVDVGKLPPPNIAFNEVGFSYSGEKKDYLYKDLSFGIDMDSRYVETTRYDRGVPLIHPPATESELLLSVTTVLENLPC
jgi:hypothetical protein